MKHQYLTQCYILLFQALIIGYRTGKILFMGVRNKYCMICNRAEQREVPPSHHTCFKNWGVNQSASSMEADIIVEGFRESVNLHQIRYKRFIGDGDSSVFSKLLQASPYPAMVIEKLECRNHLFRNMGKKITALEKKGPGKAKLRKHVSSQSKRMRGAMEKAIKHHIEDEIPMSEKITRLKRDIHNTVYHIFGDHSNCADYFCSGSSKENETNKIPEIKAEKELWILINNAIQPMYLNARSLIFNVIVI